MPDDDLVMFYADEHGIRESRLPLADIIPDRLLIKTRRWDPFYATLHQVVTKPSQAEFNGAGFNAFVVTQYNTSPSYMVWNGSMARAIELWTCRAIWFNSRSPMV